MRRHLQLPYTVEGWERQPRWAGLVGALSEIAVAVGYILVGVGIAWILMVLHGAGWTP